MNPRTDKDIVETGRKAYHMGIDLPNIPFKTDKERKLLEQGWSRAKSRFEHSMPKRRR